jgi:hypothetical protein
VARSLDDILNDEKPELVARAQQRAREILKSLDSPSSQEQADSQDSDSRSHHDWNSSSPPGT